LESAYYIQVVTKMCLLVLSMC